MDCFFTSFHYVHRKDDLLKKWIHTLIFFKRLNKRLLENIGQEEEALDICYIYDPGLLMRTIFKLIKPFLDPVVKQKIVLIKSKNII